jgi:hypothetical protein
VSRAEELDQEIDRIRSLRMTLQYELSETRAALDELMCIGQMQAVLLALLQNAKNLSADQLTEIAFADRKMRDKDLKMRRRLASVLRKKFQDKGLPAPDYVASPPGSSFGLDR